MGDKHPSFIFKMNKYKSQKINGKKVDEHRLVFERFLGRKLRKGETIHHIDGNKSNNDIDNLMLFPTLSAHAKYHYEKGDLLLIDGDNKRTLIDGKLYCIDCKQLKSVKEFPKDSSYYLGIRSTCSYCYNLNRRKAS